MYLLIRVCCFISEYSFFNLHPTMYLLILDNKSRITTPLLYLHPTMYLLIRIAAATAAASLSSFTSHYVSINSALLLVLLLVLLSFTSHYVSINSYTVKCFIYSFLKFTSHYVSINSNLFLPVNSNSS